MESQKLKTGNVGEYFYTDKVHNKMTGLATYYKRKIKTEHCYCIPFVDGAKNAKVILKVTLLK